MLPRDDQDPRPKEPLRKLLESARSIAVVGLSDNRWRASHRVAEYLQGAGYRIYPVNPTITEALGERAYPSLDALPESVDIIDVFRRPEYIAELVEPAIRSGARLFWMQEGIRDAASARRLEAAGIVVVEDRCLMVDHMAMLGR